MCTVSRRQLTADLPGEQGYELSDTCCGEARRALAVYRNEERSLGIVIQDLRRKATGRIKRENMKACFGSMLTHHAWAFEAVCKEAKLTCCTRVASPLLTADNRALPWVSRLQAFPITCGLSKTFERPAQAPTQAFGEERSLDALQMLDWTTPCMRCLVTKRCMFSAGLVAVSCLGHAECLAKFCCTKRCIEAGSDALCAVERVAPQER